MSKATDIRDLIRRAFWAAREKGKPDWWRMTTPVLKNRLLALTDRQFSEEDYGARTVADFASQYPDLLSVDTTTYPPEVELRPTRIRQDLWDAVVDYRSGKTYVWDASERKVRTKRPGDRSENLFPTINHDELAGWRTEFGDRYRETLPPSDVASLDRWVHQGLRTKALPDRLQGLWNREQSWRVWERLSAWFDRSFPPDERPPLEYRAKEIAHPEPEPVRTSDVNTSTAVNDELAQCRDAGNWLGLGELLCSKFAAAAADGLEALFAQAVVAWASPLGLLTVSGIADIVKRIEEFDPDSAATALINVSYRLRKAGRENPDRSSDLTFRLSEPIARIYGVSTYRNISGLCLSATTKLVTARSKLEMAVQAFVGTNPLTAKAISIDVLRAVHEYRSLSLLGERPYLRELDVVLGSSFRKFCESCERHAGYETIRRADELRVQITRLTSNEQRIYSSLWTEVVRPVVAHVADLIDEGTRRSEEFNRPALSLTKGPSKLDLKTCGTATTLTCRLENSGQGRASRIDAIPDVHQLPIEIDLVEPKRPFELAGNSSQVLSFTIVMSQPCERLTVPIEWVCSDSSGRSIKFKDELLLEQQSTQPNWDALLLQPPYTINPVRKKEALYGRDAVLKRLQLHAASGASTFLWGQKRVGKTSVLQVLASELDRSSNIVCVFLRMGELVALHEGQIAHTIASRVSERCGSGGEVPGEEYFGAGLSRLVPFVEQLARKTDKKLVVIIDEFDDLDPAYYTGERGHQFVKALRSLSEVGLTFFFVGSERMDTIYRSHDIELNKWVNVSLDRIESIADCKALIAEPVRGAIEYEDSAVDLIVEYCAGNPFYMHLFCYETFKRCAEERRTYVSSTDVQVVRQNLLRTLGRTNFAHFWEDNPELDPKEKVRQTAENCLVLACIASLGGRYEDMKDVLDGQETLGLSDVERMTYAVVARTIERLRRRRVLSLNSRDARTEVSLPIFRDWLAENAEQLLPTWREFVRLDRDKAKPAATPLIVHEPVTAFPIGEDELLAVSQRLVYCGKQKDVAEVRQWLRQFDDDSRIEVAFLLLKRLAEQGYMSEGVRGRTLNNVEEALQDLRLRIGDKKWTIVRGRKDNLCITFVDSETKSGSATARELAKRIRPGKVADADNIGNWLRSHAQDDPLLLIVDDFSGTGRTLETGLRRLMSQPDGSTVKTYREQGRVACYCQFAFPEALERLRTEFPDIEFYAAHVFGDDVRALDTQAGLFENSEDIVYARDILLQIGRELTPQNPLGYGDMGALVAFHNTIPNNTLPMFWSNGRVNDRPWQPLFPRA